MVRFVTPALTLRLPNILLKLFRSTNTKRGLLQLGKTSTNFFIDTKIKYYATAILCMLFVLKLNKEMQFFKCLLIACSETFFP